jgi:hypothetical protein
LAIHWEITGASAQIEIIAELGWNKHLETVILVVAVFNLGIILF